MYARNKSGETRFGGLIRVREMTGSMTNGWTAEFSGTRKLKFGSNSMTTSDETYGKTRGWSEK